MTEEWRGLDKNEGMGIFLKVKGGWLVNFSHAGLLLGPLVKIACKNIFLHAVFDRPQRSEFCRRYQPWSTCNL